MIFTPSGPKDDLSDAISRFLQDCLIRNNNETENLEVRGSAYLWRNSNLSYLDWSQIRDTFG